MKKISFNNSSLLIFIMIALFYAIGNFIWWKLNTPVIPIGISAIHFNDIFRNEIFYYNAPLIAWIMKGMFFVFGKEYFDLQNLATGYNEFLNKYNFDYLVINKNDVIYYILSNYGYENYKEVLETKDYLLLSN